MKKPDKKIGALITVFNEGKYLDIALRNVYPYVDFVSIVEGSYFEMQKVGAPAFSNDGTIEIIDRWVKSDTENKIIYTSFNGDTDKTHRNVGAKELIGRECEWLVIVDGDELIPDPLWILVYKHIENYIEGQSARVVYFKSQTYINDYRHYTWQHFPRLFKLGDNFRFCDDNYAEWDHCSWQDARKTSFELVPYHHFAFTKGIDKFLQKKKWWEDRFADRGFRYDWHVEDIAGKKVIVPENHHVYELNKIPKLVEEQLGDILEENR